MIKGITIDGAGSKDLDDAVWVERQGKNLCVFVSIANVANQVQLNGELDALAKQRMYSVYSNKHCIKPMFPRSLSEGSLSLNEGSEREVMVFGITLDQEFNVSDTQVTVNSFRNNHRITHEQVESIIAQKHHPLSGQLKALASLGQSLLKKRISNGALSVYDLQAGWRVSEEGVVTHLDAELRNVGYIIVQELMILANSVMAAFCVKNDIPCLYRNHKVSLGAPTNVELMSDVNTAFQSGNANLVSQLQRRMNLIMGRATVDPVVHGHHCLNLDAYAYFTSPIRRYPDLVNQRNLSSFIKNEPYAYSVDDLAEISEQYNTACEQRKKDRAEFFKEHNKAKAVQLLGAKGLEGMSNDELSSYLKEVLRSSEIPEDSILMHFLDRVLRGYEDNKLLAKLVALGSAKSDAVNDLLFRVIFGVKGLKMSLFNILRQTGVISGDQFSIQEGDQQGDYLSSLRCCFNGTEFITPERLAVGKKAANEQSLLDFYSLILGRPLEEVREVKKKIKDEKAKTDNGMGFVQNENYKGAVNELFQRKKLPLPVATFEKEGDDHCPSFVASIKTKMSDQVITLSSMPWTSKKLAERQVFKSLYEHLQGI